MKKLTVILMFMVLSSSALSDPGFFDSGVTMQQLIETMDQTRVDVRIVPDPEGFDVWQTPYESRTLGADCEDLVLYMRYLLLLAGVRDQDIRLVAGRPYFSPVGHMVLWSSRYIADPLNGIIYPSVSYLDKGMDVWYVLTTEGLIREGKIVSPRSEFEPWQRYAKAYAEQMSLIEEKVK